MTLTIQDCIQCIVEILLYNHLVPFQIFRFDRSEARLVFPLCQASKAFFVRIHFRQAAYHLDQTAKSYGSGTIHVQNGLCNAKLFGGPSHCH